MFRQQLRGSRQTFPTARHKQRHHLPASASITAKGMNANEAEGVHGEPSYTCPLTLNLIEKVCKSWQLKYRALSNEDRQKFADAGRLATTQHAAGGESFPIRSERARYERGTRSPKKMDLGDFDMDGHKRFADTVMDGQPATHVPASAIGQFGGKQKSAFQSLVANHSSYLNVLKKQDRERQKAVEEEAFAHCQDKKKHPPAQTTSREPRACEVPGFSRPAPCIGRGVPSRGGSSRSVAR